MHLLHGDVIAFRWFHHKAPTVTMGIWDLLIPNIEFADLDKERPGQKGEVLIPPP